MSFKRCYPAGTVVLAKQENALHHDNAIIIEYNEDKTLVKVKWVQSERVEWIKNDSECVNTSVCRQRKSAAKYVDTLTFSTNRRKKRENQIVKRPLQRLSSNSKRSTLTVSSDDSSVFQENSTMDDSYENDSNSDDKESEISDSDLFDEDSSGSGDETVEKQEKRIVSVGIDKNECEEAVKTSFQTLSRYRDALQPFITPRVFAKLSSSSVSKSKKIVEEIVEQPKMLSKSCVMREYQIEGLSWLVRQYDNCIGAILADEMGLGKTLQTIAFITYLRQVRKLKGPHLIVVPLSVVFNWIAEFKKFNPSLNVLRVHSNDTGEQDRLKKLIRDIKTEVVVTTYDTIKQGGLVHALHSVIWRSVVLDEGHRIKNEDSLVSKACYKLRARFKLILTGTPVQNNMREAFAMLQFLQPNVFVDSTPFEELFNIVKQVQIDRAMLNKAHYLMRVFVLRRLKSEVEQKLPMKLETRINCPMTDMQLFWVKLLLLKDHDLFSKLIEMSQNAKRYSGELRRLNSLVAQLRKAANHPYLFPGAELPSLTSVPTEDIVAASGKMIVLDMLLKRLFLRGHRVVVFSQFTRTLDIISDYLDMREIRFCRLDGSTNRVMREVNINAFNKPKSPFNLFLLSTRAGGEGVNLFTADTVILFDSDWNPQVDIQAMARVHRIGQKKIVHIYRLVSVGSIEERIVQRAQKKLFLDTMVNRGSTATAVALDTVDDEAKNDDSKSDNSEIDNEESTKDDEDDVNNISTSKLLSTLKFGWNRVFSVTNNDKTSYLTEDEIDIIIDRSRGLQSEADTKIENSSGEVNFAESSKDINSEADRLLDNQEKTLVDFDENAPLAPIRCIEQELGVTAHTNNEMSIEDIASLWHKKNNTLTDDAPNDNKEISADIVKEVFDESKLSESDKRTRRSRTVTLKVPGVGEVKIFRDESGELESMKRSSSKAKQLNLFEQKSGRQVAGRDFEHQDICQVCWDGGEILICDLCPCAAHEDCLPKKHRPFPKQKRWLCTHHFCYSCDRRAAAVELLFRCDMCENAYCEDCLPADAKILGASERYEALGYNSLNSSSCYVVCSRDCWKFAKSDSSRILGLTLSYLEDDNTHDVDSVKDNPQGNEQSNNDLSEVHNKNPKKSKERRKSNSDGFDDSTTQNDIDAMDVTENDIGGDKNEISQPRTVVGVDPVKAVSECALIDVKKRLTRCNISNNARFRSLKEIPNFDFRMTSSSGQVVGILGRLIHHLNMNYIKSSQSNMDNEEEAFRSNQSEYVKSIVYNFSGLPSTTSYEDIAQAFLDTVRSLSSASKFEIKQICRVLGICSCQIFRIKNTPVEQIEPQFRLVGETFNRQGVDEAIAAFLIIPHPQNMLLPATGFGQDLPVDSLFYVFRLLEALGEYISDGNSLFCALSVKQEDKYYDRVKTWYPMYPTGKPASSQTLDEWLDPAIRLFSELKAAKTNIGWISPKLRSYLNSRTNKSGQKTCSLRPVEKLDSDAESNDTESDGDYDASDNGSSDESNEAKKGKNVIMPPGVKVYLTENHYSTWRSSIPEQQRRQIILEIVEIMQLVKWIHMRNLKILRKISQEIERMLISSAPSAELYLSRLYRVNQLLDVNSKTNIIKNAIQIFYQSAVSKGIFFPPIGKVITALNLKYPTNSTEDPIPNLSATDTTVENSASNLLSSFFQSTDSSAPNPDALVASISSTGVGCPNSIEGGSWKNELTPSRKSVMDYIQLCIDEVLREKMLDRILPKYIVPKASAFMEKAFLLACKFPSEYLNASSQKKYVKDNFLDYFGPFMHLSPLSTNKSVSECVTAELNKTRNDSSSNASAALCVDLTGDVPSVVESTNMSVIKSLLINYKSTKPNAATSEVSHRQYNKVQTSVWNNILAYFKSKQGEKVPFIQIEIWTTSIMTRLLRTSANGQIFADPRNYTDLLTKLSDSLSPLSNDEINALTKQLAESICKRNIKELNSNSNTISKSTIPDKTAPLNTSAAVEPKSNASDKNHILFNKIQMLVETVLKKASHNQNKEFTDNLIRKTYTHIILTFDDVSKVTDDDIHKSFGYYCTVSQVSDSNKVENEQISSEAISNKSTEKATNSANSVPQAANPVTTKTVSEQSVSESTVGKGMKKANTLDNSASDVDDTTNARFEQPTEPTDAIAATKSMYADTDLRFPRRNISKFDRLKTTGLLSAAIADFYRIQKMQNLTRQYCCDFADSLEQIIHLSPYVNQWELYNSKTATRSLVMDLLRSIHNPEQHVKPTGGNSFTGIFDQIKLVIMLLRSYLQTVGIFRPECNPLLFFKFAAAIERRVTVKEINDANITRCVQNIPHFDHYISKMLECERVRGGRDIIIEEVSKNGMTSIRNSTKESEKSNETELIVSNVAANVPSKENSAQPAYKLDIAVVRSTVRSILLEKSFYLPSVVIELLCEQIFKEMSNDERTMAANESAQHEYIKEYFKRNLDNDSNEQRNKKSKPMKSIDSDVLVVTKQPIEDSKVTANDKSVSPSLAPLLKPNLLKHPIYLPSVAPTPKAVTVPKSSNKLHASVSKQPLSGEELNNVAIADNVKSKANDDAKAVVQDDDKLEEKIEEKSDLIVSSTPPLPRSVTEVTDLSKSGRDNENLPMSRDSIASQSSAKSPDRNNSSKVIDLTLSENITVKRESISSNASIVSSSKLSHQNQKLDTRWKLQLDLNVRRGLISKARKMLKQKLASNEEFSMRNKYKEVSDIVRGEHMSKIELKLISLASTEQEYFDEITLVDRFVAAFEALPSSTKMKRNEEGDQGSIDNQTKRIRNVASEFLVAGSQQSTKEKSPSSPSKRPFDISSDYLNVSSEAAKRFKTSNETIHQQIRSQNGEVFRNETHMNQSSENNFSEEIKQSSVLRWTGLYWTEEDPFYT